MSELTDLFTNGFKQFNLDDPSQYGKIYAHFMGVDMAHPNDILNIETTAVNFPNFEDLSEATQNILMSREVKIGVYIHEPYYYLNEVSKEDGFEYMLAEAVFEKISLQYGSQIGGNVTIKWVPVDVDFSEYSSGSENDAIQKALAENLGIDYHMVFTGIFTSVGAINNPADSPYHYAEPTAVFYIGALYTGKGDFGQPATVDLEEIGAFFAKNSTEADPISIIHSSGGLQTTSAGYIKDAIEAKDGFAVTIEIIDLEDLEPTIVNQAEHIYTGDLIQIQRMVMENEPCYDLDVNVLYDSMEEGSFRVYTPFTLPITEELPK